MLKPARLFVTYFKAGDGAWKRVRQEPQPKEQADVDAAVRRNAGWEVVVVEEEQCPECDDYMMEAIQGGHQCGTCCLFVDAASQ